MTDVAPAAWNADARSRAQTRGLLMALSRDRTNHFTRSPFAMTVLGLMSAGIIPLVVLGPSLQQRQRLQWSQLSAFAGWIGDFRDRNVGDRLRKEANRLEAHGILRLSPRLVAMTIAVLAPVGVAAVRFWPKLFNLVAAPGMVWIPVWWSFVLYLGCLALTGSALIDLLNGGAVWTRALDDYLVSQEQRAVDAVRVHLFWNVPLAVAGLACIAGFRFPGPTLVLAGAATLYATFLWNRSLASSRIRNIQLIERLLEWMDDSELPIEYDVVALNPDEIAAMMA